MTSSIIHINTYMLRFSLCIYYYLLNTSGKDGMALWTTSDCSEKPFNHDHVTKKWDTHNAGVE